MIYKGQIFREKNKTYKSLKKKNVRFHRIQDGEFSPSF